MVEKTKKNLIALAIVIAGILIAGAIVFVSRGKKVESGILSPQAAAEKAIDFINKNLLPQGQSASLVNVTEENGLYKFRLKIGDKEYDSYVTKNGKLLFTSGIDLTAKKESQKEVSKEIPKAEKPDVKLFVMSYCPFGLQMEKAYLPVYNLLKEKTNMGIYFVDYAMHGKKEIDENLRQYCIQKEQKEKYYDYLSCFIKDGDFEKCLSTVGIDKNKLENCILKTDQEYKITQSFNDKSTWLNGRFPKFAIYTDLNEKYGVSGSPTVVINDQKVAVDPRSPENFKKIICQAFNSPPKECSQKLSDRVFSPGFGQEEGSESGGECK